MASLLAAPPSRQRHRRRRASSIESTSSTSSSPERSVDDDGDSIMHVANDSQSSLGASLEDMELDASEFEERCRQSPIKRLPPEIFLQIFQKLASPADLLSCMLTCKSWARNSVELLWHRPATQTWINLHVVMRTVRMRDGYFDYADLVKRLNLAQLGQEVSDGTLDPLSACKRIERLTLTDCSRLTDLSVSRLIDGNKALLAIDVTGLDSLTDRTMASIAKNCYRLQGLNISKCRKITDQALMEIAKHCRRIKRLKLNDCNQLTDASVIAFADNCHDILEIDLQRVLNMTDLAVTQILVQSRQLREFRLAHCSAITDQAFLQLPPDAPSFDALRILDLTDCSELRDDGISKIVDSAPRLRNLVLAKCRAITDRGVVAITRLGKNLHYIHLGHCAQITDYGVSHLVTKCNRIRYIDLACCSNLTDGSVELLSSLPKLKRIGLVKCHNITDRSIRSLAYRPYGATGALYPNSLERLHLSYCTNLTILGIRTLLQRCNRLTHLSLTGVQNFLRDDILSFCRPAPTEFNEHQRDVFCVFSGPGVQGLRKHLKDSYMPAAPDVDMEEGEAWPIQPFTTQPFDPSSNTGLFPGMHLAHGTFHPHQGQHAVPIPPHQLAHIHQQLAQLHTLHQHGDGHHYAQQGGAPINFQLPPPPPPQATQVPQITFSNGQPFIQPPHAPPESGGRSADAIESRSSESPVSEAAGVVPVPVPVQVQGTPEPGPAGNGAPRLANQRSMSDVAEEDAHDDSRDDDEE